MHRLGHAIVVLAAVTLGGCIKLDSFQCAQSSECQDGDMPGTCEPTGLCSFPDLTCPSGKKYGALAGSQSGQCVDDGPGGGSSGTTDPPTTSTPTTGGATFDPTTAGTTFDPTTMTSEVSVGSTSTTDPTTLTSEPATTEPDTTTGPICGDIGEACVDGACCGPCTACQDGMCVPGDAAWASLVCGSACATCTEDGQCGAMPAGTPCPVDCKDVVWLPKIEGSKTACYAYDPLPVMSTCDDAGVCTLPAPASCSELNGGTLLVSCDNVCLKDAGLCMQGLPASAVTAATYCFLDTVTEGCQPACTVDKLQLDIASCDGNGVCFHEQDACGAYFCDVEQKTCPSKCSSDADCVSNDCMGTKCQ